MSLVRGNQRGQMFRLLVEMDGGRILRQFEMTEESYKLGRGKDCDFVFDTPKVSRHHATLKRESSGTYVISDNGSRNGLFINGNKTTSHTLLHGDIINISRRVALLYIESGSLAEAFETLSKELWVTAGKDDILRLQEVTGRLISLGSLDTILHTVLQEAIAFVKGDRGFIALTDDDGVMDSKTCVTHNIPLDAGMDVRNFVSRTALTRAVQDREHVTIPNTELLKDGLTSSAAQLNLGALMCYPLVFSDDLVGVLYVDSGARIAHFSDLDHFYFKLLADQAAIAIENAKLYDRLRKVNQKLEDRVEESERRYSELIHISPDAIVVTADRTITFANPAAVELFAVGQVETLLGQDITLLVHSDYRELLNEALGKRESFQALILRNGEEPVDVDLATAPATFEGAKGTLIMARDMTERRKFEAELLKAQKLDSVSTLAGGLAHDFNNILTAILGNISVAEMRLGRGRTDDLAPILKKSEKGCLQARELTRQLLTFARGGDPIKRVVSIRDLVHDTVTLMLRGTSVRGDFSLSNKLHCAEVDHGQIGQVINNIVLNAVQAMPAGGTLKVTGDNVTIKQGCKRNLAPGQYVLVTFRDEGVGIPEKHLPNIFDPYFTTKQEGSGLGLATAYSIVKKHGGLLAAESILGAGSTLLVYLPASMEEPKRLPTPTDSFFEGTGAVLIMDDEEDVREVAGRMLEEFGFTADYAKDGLEALSKYKHALDAGSPYRFVIMDLTVPGGMGGASAITELRKMDPKALVVVSSGYSTDPVMANYREAGFDGMVEKPYNMKRMKTVVAHLLDLA